MTELRLRELLRPFLLEQDADALPSGLFPRLLTYLELLVRWNARTNLTAIRDSEEMVTRHFGESLFTACLLRSHIQDDDDLLDIGSGAGFPGLPLQLCFPSLRVTLAESQGKKASFLREAVRTLEVKTEVWAGRIEDMPPERRFCWVTLRAVDKMPRVLDSARERLIETGTLVELTSADAAQIKGWTAVLPSVPIPLSLRREIRLLRTA